MIKSVFAVESVLMARGRRGPPGLSSAGVRLVTVRACSGSVRVTNSQPPARCLCVAWPPRPETLALTLNSVLDCGGRGHRPNRLPRLFKRTMKAPQHFLVVGLTGTVVLCALCMYVLDAKHFELFNNKDLAIVSVASFKLQMVICNIIVLIRSIGHMIRIRLLKLLHERMTMVTQNCGMRQARRASSLNLLRENLRLFMENRSFSLMPPAG